MKMCRGCLAQDQDMEPMDTDIIHDYNVITNLGIQLTVDLPLYICQFCLKAVNFCLEFRNKCILSHSKFNQVLHSKSTYPLISDSSSNIVKNDEETIDITNEIKSELEFDYNVMEDENETFIEDCDNINIIIKTEEDEDWKPKQRRRNPKRNSKIATKNLPEIPKVNVKITKKNKVLNYEGTIINCGLCTKKFENMEMLMNHFECHKTEASCGVCMEQYLDFTHILAHRISHVPNDQRICHICSKKFIRPATLEFHYMKKHNFRGEDGKLHCKICLKPFSTPLRLKIHERAVHCDIKYICDDCGKGFRAKSYLRAHVTKHSNVKMYACDQCNFSCKIRNGLKVHKIRKHTAQMVPCTTCSRPFPSASHLAKHECKHQLRIICPICGINIKSNLNRHLKTHENIFPYTCDRCPKKFKTYGSHRAHMNRHDDVRPYRCEHCPMRFYSQSVLIKHRRVHTGEKPYVCNICEKAFTGNHNLKVHMKVHGQYLVKKKNTESLAEDSQ